MEKVTKPIVLNETFSEKLNTTNGFLSAISESCKTISADVPKVTTGTSADGSTTITVENKDGSTTTELVDGIARSSVDSLSSNVNTRMSAIETEQSVQSARMDTFTSLPEGSTSGNAELADIRVGAEGTTYDTAGNAVRGQIGELKSDLDGLSLIDLGEIVDGYFVSSEHGTMPSYNTYSRTDKINVENISKIAIYVGTNADGVGGAFYSKNEESITDGFISGVNFGGHTIGETLIVDVPSGAKYFALSSNTVNKDKMFIRIVSLKQTLDNIVEKLNTEHISYDIDLGTLVDGFVNSKYGTFISASTYKRTDFIPIVGKTIMVTDTFNVTEVGFAFYDSYYQFISGFDGTGHNRGDVIKVEIPNNAKYFAYCSPNSLVDNMKVSIFDIADATIPNNDNPIEYEGNDIVAFNKILCIGDSMTEGTFNKRVDGVNTAYIDTRYAYPTLLKAMTNRDVTNMGSGGESTKSWYNLHKNDDLSGHDACIIALGINDGHGTSSVQTTSEERITALNNIIAKVKAENKGIKIFLSTIFNTYKASIDEEINADIRTVANSTEDVYLIDMAVYGNIIKEVTGVYSDTATHLTAIGYRKLAQGYFAYISYIMSKNSNDFAFVHFAGTDNAY